MADRSDVINLRILINDPPGFVNIADVANEAALPVDSDEPEQDTCYYLTGVKRYVAPKDEYPQTASDYETQRVRISDTMIGELIDGLGIDKARCEALRVIMTKLGADMQLKSTSMGGDVSSYTDLAQMYAYYKGLVAQCAEDTQDDVDNSTGRGARMTNPEIAGGLT